QLLVELGDPELDVLLDVLGDDLTRLDDLAQELLEVVLGAGGFLVALRLGGLDDLVEQARGLGGLGRGGGAFLSGGTHFDSSFGAPSAPVSMPISFASSMARSVLLSTSPSSFSSLSLPSILLKSCVSRLRMSSSSLRGPTCSATRAGAKSSML